jgi:hypothetical protein
MPNIINADNGVASGFAGVRTTADGTGNLALQSNGVTLMTLATNNTVTISGTTSQTGNASFGNASFSGRAGVGTAAPNNYLQITGAKTNTDVASTGQVVIQDTTAYNGSPQAGIQFSVKYNASGSYAYGTSIQGIKDNTTDGDFGQSLVFVTQSNGTSPFEKMRLTSTGNLQIGSTGINARLGVQSASSDGSSTAIYLQNSSATQLMYVRNDGYFTTGAAAYSPYNYATGLGANVYIDGNGGLLRSTSSIKYKHDVKDAYYGLADVLKLRPVTYKSKNDGETIHGGLIAEEVDAAGLKEFVQYNTKNEPDALSYGNMVSLCIKAIQELNAKVDAQAAEIAALKAGA